MNYQGEKIEKNIRFNKKTQTYYVQFTFSDRVESKLRTFPTLESARAYRDAVNAEKVALKIREDTAKIRESDKSSIIHDKTKDLYPFNMLEAALSYQFTDSNLRDRVNPKILVEDENGEYPELNSLIERLTFREQKCLFEFYKERKNLAEVSQIFGFGRERARQIIAKGIRKLGCYICRYDKEIEEARKRRQEEEAVLELKAKREELIEAFREKGIITEDMIVYFGEPTFDYTAKGCEQQIKNYGIEELDLSVRSYNCLRRAGINTLGNLCEKTESQVYRIRNLGKKSFKEIKEKLEEYGLSFAGGSEYKN